MEEKQAIELFLQTRSEEAYFALFESLYARLRRYFILRGLESGVAEELAQNVMLIIYRRGGDVREKDHFHGWVFKIAKNELMRHWRQTRARSEIIEFEPLCDEIVDRWTTIEPDQNSNFAEWLTYLDPAEREILILRFVEDLSYEELAVALGIPVGTVKWRLFNVKKKLLPIIDSAQRGNQKKRIN